MMVFHQGAESLLCVARKMGFGTPLLYFLIFRLYLYLMCVKKIYENDSHEFYLYSAHTG